MTAAGILTITGQRFRSQERNRQDAIDRLVDLIQRAAVRPIIRRVSAPSKGLVQQRLDEKRRRSTTKRTRTRPSSDD
jgi:ribosome-associated protein